jgi:hypothetical protein
MNWERRLRLDDDLRGLGSAMPVVPAMAEIGERQGTTEKWLRFEILKISRIRYCSFRAPLQRGFLVAWAGKPQILSPVAATTYRVSLATWKARRESPKVAENGGFPAKFKRLYTSRTWRFSGWRSRAIVCCMSSDFILHPSLERQSRHAGMEPALCWLYSYADPSRSGGRGAPVPSAR